MTNPDPITITLPDGASIALTTTDNDGESETRMVVTSARGAVKADVPTDRDSLIALSYAVRDTMHARQPGGDNGRHHHKPMIHP